MDNHKELRFLGTALMVVGFVIFLFEMFKGQFQAQINYLSLGIGTILAIGGLIVYLSGTKKIDDAREPDKSTPMKASELANIVSIVVGVVGFLFVVLDLLGNGIVKPKGMFVVYGVILILTFLISRNIVSQVREGEKKQAPEPEPKSKPKDPFGIR